MTFQFNNSTIFYETFGNGPAIVLLHGFLESATMWIPLIPQLSKNNALVTIDFPGHGKSDVVSKIHSMELMAEIVDELLLHLNITSATFIGHSMGGYVALAYTELFSEKVDKIVLLNSSPVSDSEEKKKSRNRALRIIDQNPKAYISMAIGNLFAETSREKFYSEIEALKAEAYTFPVEGIKAAIRGMRDRKDRTEILRNFTKVKHLILAKEDPILSLPEARKIVEYTGCTATIIAGGHMSVIENKDAVVNYLHLIS